MEETTSFGDWLKERRRALDMTQEELAQRLGVALGTLRKWETEERRPSKELAARLAELLEVPPAERPAEPSVGDIDTARTQDAFTPQGPNDRIRLDCPRPLD